MSETKKQRTNGSYGLTTLKGNHVRIEGSTLRFQFKGKSGIRHSIDLTNRRLARIVRDCHDLPGQELFQYVDDAGTCQSIDSSDVNGFLKEITDEEFTAKDFRTWAGTVLAVLALMKSETSETVVGTKHNMSRRCKPLLPGRIPPFAGNATFIRQFQLYSSGSADRCSRAKNQTRKTETTASSAAGRDGSTCPTR